MGTQRFPWMHRQIPRAAAGDPLGRRRCQHLNSGPTCRTSNVALRTFIVEDNPDAFATLSEYLAAAAGAENVGWATGERQARAFLERNPAAWDLAIVDLFLVEGTGLGVLEACRERPARRKVVVMSNYATAEMRSRCRQLGANAVFDKVTELAALVAFCKEAGDEAAGR